LPFSFILAILHVKLFYRAIGWLEFNVPFRHKYGYIRDEFYREMHNAVRPSVDL